MLKDNQSGIELIRQRFDIPNDESFGLMLSEDSYQIDEAGLPEQIYTHYSVDQVEQVIKHIRAIIADNRTATLELTGSYIDQWARTYHAGADHPFYGDIVPGKGDRWLLELTGLQGDIICD